MPYGLGQPSNARYDISAGGWKTFGKQGQYVLENQQANPTKDSRLFGMKPVNSEKCEHRYVMILVQHKVTTFTEKSHLVLDIAVMDFADYAKRMIVSFSAAFTIGLVFANVY